MDWNEYNSFSHLENLLQHILKSNKEKEFYFSDD